jgi:hypothetical protein
MNEWAQAHRDQLADSLEVVAVRRQDVIAL